MPRPHIQIEVEGETPFRIISSPDRENEGRFFNILDPSLTPDGEWNWDHVLETVGLTEEEVLEGLTTALRGLPSYPRQLDGSRKIVQG